MRKVGESMKAFIQRLGKAFDTVRDPTSYRLLLCNPRRDLMPVLKGELDEGVPQDVGWPEDAPDQSADRIPRIIFQPWISRQALPANYRYWRQSFVANNPGYKFFFWDGADNRSFIARWFPWFLPQFDSYSHDVSRTDITRLFFLYAHGGFSIHMDSECLKPLNAFESGSDVVVGRMGFDPKFEQSVPNAIMASRPKQIFWLLAVAIAIERFSQSKARTDLKPEWLTGPVLLKDAVDFYRTHSRQIVSERITRFSPELAIEMKEASFGRLSIVPSEIWCPINWNNYATTFFRKKMFERRNVLGPESAGRLFPKSFIVTYWSAPWD